MERICKHKKALVEVCTHGGKSKLVRCKLFAAQKNRKELVKAIVDMVHNVLNGRIKVNNKRRLNKYKQDLRFLVNRKVSLARKQHRIIQKGGFLPFLAPLIPLFIKAAAVAGPLIAKAATFAGPAIAKGALAGAASIAASKLAEKATS